MRYVSSFGRLIGNKIKSFLDLFDTPTSYSGKSGLFVKVNVTEDGVEFGSGGGGSGDVTGAASSIDSNITEFNGTDGKVIKDGGLTHTNAADAISKKHTQGTDQALDTGGANEVTAINAKLAVTHKDVTSGNPHSVTKTEVGLGSCDNTTDTDKPVSTATQTALNLKVTGSTSSVDNTIPRFDSTTGKLLQGSGVVIDDTDNVTIGATITSIHTFDEANWNEDDVTWTMAGAGALVHIPGNTTAVTATLTEVVVPGTTYKITIIGTGGGDTATYTFAGVQGTTIESAGVIAITDYITAVNTISSLVITPTSTCTVSITNVTIEKLIYNTGDLIVDGVLTARSPAVFGGGITLSGGGITATKYLSATTGNEAAYTLNYTTNKAAGNDTGLLINMTDIISPGTSYFIDGKVGGISRFYVDIAGTVYVSDVGLLRNQDGNFAIKGSTYNKSILLNSAVSFSTPNMFSVKIPLGNLEQTSGTNGILSLSTTYNQTSGTAANTDLHINRTETAVGSGEQLFLSMGTTALGVLTKFRNDGVYFPRQAATASAPTYTLGGIYFDTTLNKLRVGGVSAWETVVSS